jgi:hypothetical protein
MGVTHITGSPDFQSLQIIRKLGQINGVIDNGMVGRCAAVFQMLKVGVYTGRDGVVHVSIVTFCVGIDTIF